jgi:hypothetical protein
MLVWLPAKKICPPGISKGEIIEMNLLFYQSTNNGSGEHLREVIHTLVSEDQTEIYTMIEDLSFRLRQPMFDVDLAILLAFSKSDLLDLLLLRDLLLDVRIILILPDRKRDTISRGHSLYPRFLSYVDSDFKDVAAVLDKMMQIDHSK